MSSIIRGSDNFDSGSVGPSTTLGDVGTYAFLQRFGNILQGSTVSGSSLKWANSGRLGFTNSGTSPTGTWRQMGCSGYFNGSTSGGDTLNQTVYVRIS